MRPAKVFQFVNIAEVPEKISVRKFDDALRSSIFKIPGYLNRNFPLYRDVAYWPGISDDGDKNEFVYRFGEGTRGELRFDTKCNLTLRMEFRDRAELNLKILLEEILSFYLYFNRAIRAAGGKGNFRLSLALENLHGIPIFYSELKEEDGFDNFSNWSLPEDEIIEESVPLPFSLPGSDLLVPASKELNALSELLVEVAFNIVGFRYDPMKGNYRDRLRLDRKVVADTAVSLSREIYGGLSDSSRK